MAWTEQTGKHAWRVRYPASDGHIASVSGFTSQKAADDYAADIETDQRRRLWIDPALGKTTIDDWATRWLPSLDIDIRTFGNYSGHLRNHILPRWGTTPLAELSTLDITGWIKQLHDSGYAPATVSGFVKLLSMMLEDAVDEHIIPTNPVRRRRRSVITVAFPIPPGVEMYRLGIRLGYGRRYVCNSPPPHHRLLRPLGNPTPQLEVLTGWWIGLSGMLHADFGESVRGICAQSFLLRTVISGVRTQARSGFSAAGFVRENCPQMFVDRDRTCRSIA